MVRIRVTPSQLRTLSNNLQQASQQVREVGDRLSGAAGGLDWESRHRAGVDDKVNAARGRANDLANQAQALARFLAAKANSFEEADSLDARALSGLHSRWSKWQADFKAIKSVLAAGRASPWYESMANTSWNYRFFERDQLRIAIEAEDGKLGSPVSRIRELEKQLKDLERQRAQARKKATDLLNQVMPDFPLGLDADGVPWRVRADAYEDEVRKLDADIERLTGLKQKYTRYFVLDDMVQQGIPADGPSKEMSLYGCTYYAASRRNVDSWAAWGSGADWVRNAKDAGWEVGQVPVKGALISFQAGTGYYDEAAGGTRGLHPDYGHVAYVEEVDWSVGGDTVRIRISEGNYVKGQAPGPGTVRKDVWVTISKQDLESGNATFIYGPARPEPGVDYMA